ncbi:MAG: NAD(P)-dependent oxidoreductase [Alphaproteobacteria bacterium]|nr:NAD(P)-dependent oxidoreductase [Alphaproteobacteria bacterium]
MMQPSVGLIGVGAMGSGIASCISRAGLSLLVFDADIGKLDSISKMPLIKKSTASEIITNCDLILMCVPSSIQIEQMLVSTFPKKDATIVDLTSSDPRVTESRAEKLLKEFKVNQLDAAMSGGANGAAAGTLTLMVGGDGYILEKYMPIFNTFADKIFHIGDAGKGQLMKLFHNAVCHGNFLLLSEICIKGEQNGLDLAQMIDVFNCSNARSYISEKRFPDHILSGTFDGRSTPANLKKDLGLLDELLKGDEVEQSYLAHSLNLLNMLDPTFENDDFMLIYPHLKQILEK